MKIQIEIDVDVLTFGLTESLQILNACNTPKLPKWIQRQLFSARDNCFAMLEMVKDVTPKRDDNQRLMNILDIKSE